MCKATYMWGELSDNVADLNFHQFSLGKALVMQIVVRVIWIMVFLQDCCAFAQSPDVALSQRIKCVNSNQFPQRQTVWEVKLNPVSDQVAVACSDGALRVFDIGSGRRDGECLGHIDAVTCASFSPDGQRIVSGSGDKTLKIWDLSTYEDIRTFEGHSAAVFSVAYNPTGGCVASRSKDGAVIVWDVAKLKERARFQTPRGANGGLLFFPDGVSLLTWTSDGEIAVWAIESQQLRLLMNTDPDLCSVCLSHDARKIVETGFGGRITIWDAKTGQIIRRLNGKGKSLLSVAFSPADRYVAVGSQQNTLEFWTVEGEYLGIFRGQEVEGSYPCVDELQFNENGDLLISSSGEACSFWTLETALK